MRTRPETALRSSQTDESPETHADSRETQEASPEKAHEAPAQRKVTVVVSKGKQVSNTTLQRLAIYRRAGYEVTFRETEDTFMGRRFDIAVVDEV